MAKIKRDLVIFCDKISVYQRGPNLLSVSADKVDVIELVKDITWECTLPDLLKVQKLLDRRIKAKLNGRN